LRDGVGVVDEDQLPGRLGDAAVQVGGVAQRSPVLDHARAVRLLRDAARNVRDQHDLVDLGLERRQRLGQLFSVRVGDDDRRDHARAS